MPIVVDVNEAQKGRVPVDVEDYTQTSKDDDKYYATMYIGAPTDTAADDIKTKSGDKSLPQAYLVEQPAHATVPAHFHATNQFQVFVAGSTGFGKAKLKPLSVHYAGGYTPYGPIVTEDEGVHFFTLRQKWDSGGKTMPEMRHLLKSVRRCFRMAEDVTATAVLGGRSDVLPCEDDGLGIALFSLDPGQNEILDLPQPGGGQYALITDGSVNHQGIDLAMHSCLYRFSKEAPLGVKAGDDGATIMLLQFPILDEL